MADLDPYYAPTCLCPHICKVHPAPKPAQSDAPSAREFFKTYPRCISYPKCDGDLEGMNHSDECPIKNKEDLGIFAFAEAYAALRTAQQEAAFRATIEVSEKRYLDAEAKVAQLERELADVKLSLRHEIIRSGNYHERADEAEEKLTAAESALSEARAKLATYDK